MLHLRIWSNDKVYASLYSSVILDDEIKWRNTHLTCYSAWFPARFCNHSWCSVCYASLEKRLVKTYNSWFMTTSSSILFLLMGIYKRSIKSIHTWKNLQKTFRFSVPYSQKTICWPQYFWVWGMYFNQSQTFLASPVMQLRKCHYTRILQSQCHHSWPSKNCGDQCTVCALQKRYASTQLPNKLPVFHPCV